MKVILHSKKDSPTEHHKNQYICQNRNKRMILLAKLFINKHLTFIGFTLLIVVLLFLIKILFAIGLAKSKNWKLPLSFRYFKWLRNNWEKIKLAIIFIVVSGLLVLLSWLEGYFIGIH